MSNKMVPKNIAGSVFAALLCALSMALACDPQVSRAQTATLPSTRVEDWADQVYDGVRVAVAFNSFRQGRPFKKREMFILVAERHFNRADLERVFTALAGENPHPEELGVTAFSDSGMLVRAMDIEVRNFSVHFADTPGGREAARKFSERFDPLPTGYFRAYYRRSEKEEVFRYSPEKEKDEYVVVTLRAGAGSK